MDNRGPRSHQEELVKRVHRKETTGGEMQTRGRRVVTYSASGSQLNAVPFYLALSRVGEAENPGPACATTKLFDAQFDAIGQWAANLSSKSEVELAHFSHKLENADKCVADAWRKNPILTPYRSVRTSHGTHNHMDRFSLHVSPEPESDFAHTQQFCDYLSF